MDGPFINLEAFAILRGFRQGGDMSPYDFAVGTALCEFMGDRDACWPTREEIKQRTGIRRIPTISAALVKLVKIGFVFRERGQRGVTYRLNHDAHGTHVIPDDTDTVTPESKGLNPDDTPSVTPESSDDTDGVTPENSDANSRRNARRTSDDTDGVSPITLIKTYQDSASAADAKTTPTPPIEKRKASKRSAPKVTLSATGFVVPDAMLTAWRESFPLLDVNQEIKAAYARFLADGQKKTAYGRYLSNWLARGERWRRERGGSFRTVDTTTPKPTPSTGEAKRMLQFFKKAD